jgi:hypothetical protein
MDITICALNTNPNEHNSCLDDKHIKLISKFTNGNTIKEIKEETKCEDDICVLEKVSIPSKIEELIKREALKTPARGLDHNYWINNTEIDTCMSQLRKQYPGFAHGFIHMSDLKAFSPNNISSFDYKVYDVHQVDFGNSFNKTINKTNYESKLSTYNDAPLTSYGIVCNTDTSAGSGQHWFAIYISMDQVDPDNTSKPWIRIELFNSSGSAIRSSTFNSFWEKTALDISKKTNCKCTYDLVTNIQHQRDDTGNCGSYSLFYIYSRLNGVHPSSFNTPKKKVTDEAMKEFRSICFVLET